MTSGFTGSAAEQGVTQRRIDWLLWLVPALAVVAALRAPFGFADLGWQIKLGEQMLQAGTPWIREAFAARHLGEAMVPNAWLSQILYAQVNAGTGFTGLRTLDILLWASGPLIAAIPARLRPERRLAVTIAIAMGYILLLPTSGIRPQSFASAGFAITLVLMVSLRSWRVALAIGLPLFVLWQNLHPSVPIAALILGLVCAWRWGLHVIGRGPPPAALTALTMAAGIAIFATPAGLSIFAFARYNAMASQAFGATEWFPLWYPINRQFFAPFMASVGLAAMVCSAERARLTPEIVIPAMLTMVMALVTARFLFFYAIAIVPLLALLRIGRPLERAPSPRVILGGCVISAALAVLASLLLPLRSERIEADKLAQALITCGGGGAGGTVFDTPTLGGAILYYGAPRWKVAFDGRFYRFSPSEIELLQRTASDGGTLAEIERIYHPAAFALDFAANRALIDRLDAATDTWARVFDNRQVVLFMRKAKPSPGATVSRVPAKCTA